MGILRDEAGEEGPIWISVGRLDVGVYLNGGGDSEVRWSDEIQRSFLLSSLGIVI